MSEVIKQAKVAGPNKTESKGFVLYFEDQFELSSLFNEFLETENYQVVHYRSFPDGGIPEIKKSLDHQPDFVLLDIGLPGIDGNEVCKRLREEYLSAHVPIIFISGRMSEEDILNAYEAGADDYLIKPIRLMDLKHKLEQFAQQRDIREKNSITIDDAQTATEKTTVITSELGKLIKNQQPNK
jgi:DNA-binding response OmpR family regulator